MREHNVLSGLRPGLSNKDIADNLSLSEITVKHHIKSLRGKLGARNRVYAVCRIMSSISDKPRRACRWLFGRRHDSRMLGQSAILAIIHQISNHIGIGQR